MITILITIALIATIAFLILMINYFINDNDQSEMADFYAEKARKHNELMIKKESRNGPFSG